MIVLVFFFLSFVPVGLLAALFLWARWLRRRTAAHRYFVWAAYALLGAATLLFLSGFGFVGVVFLSGPQDGADKARQLAESISEAMNSGALAMTIGAATAVWLLVGTWRWRWSVKPVEVERQPPYR